MTQRIYTSQEHTRTCLVTYKEEYIKSCPVPHSAKKPERLLAEIQFRLHATCLFKPCVVSRIFDDSPIISLLFHKQLLFSQCYTVK